MVRFLRWLLSKLEPKQTVVKEPAPVKDNTLIADHTTNGHIDDELSVFKAEDMLIYSYDNGQGTVKADPMVLFKRYAEKIEEIKVDLKVAQSPMKDADQAYDKGLERIRWVFDIKPYSEGGLTEVKTLELFYHFSRFIMDIKKNSSGTPTLPPTSASPSPPSPADQ